MVSMNQIEAGVSRWLDRELMPKLPTIGQYDGLKKAATVALALYAIKRGRAALDSLTHNSFLATIGAVDHEGNIDIEGFSEEMKKQMPEAGLKVSVPMVGDMTFYRTDLDDMLRYIKG
jgi:hypothetical protein